MAGTKNNATEIPEGVMLEVLKRGINHHTISPYTCAYCAVYDGIGMMCANPVLPFRSAPGGHCDMFVHRMFRHPNDAADGQWIVMTELGKGGDGG